MSDDADDVEDITSICGGLNINIGTLNKNTIPSMFLAGKKANALGHIVLLDPVGAGDAYRGGLLFARERNLSPVVGARIGTVLGSLKVAVRGAQNWRTTPDDVRGVYASHWGEAPF